VPRVVRRAAGVLVTGTLARRSLVARGADPAVVRVFANTIDTERFAAAASAARLDRESLRARIGLEPDDLGVLSVARLSPEKALDTLVRAVAGAERPRLRLVLAGDGPERQRLERLAGALHVRTTFLGNVDWGAIVETYAAADVFVLLSLNETWAVVVNEAAACGLPLILSDQVGAAHDLLEDGVNGYVVPAGRDEAAAALALRELCDDDALREAAGRRSSEIAAAWGYGPSIDAFVAAVRAAVAGRAK
jgi:glycosyltransferase involved in cell wall biosynthesis